MLKERGVTIESNLVLVDRQNPYFTKVSLFHKIFNMQLFMAQSRHVDLMVSPTNFHILFFIYIFLIFVMFVRGQDDEENRAPSGMYIVRL